MTAENGFDFSAESRRLPRLNEALRGLLETEDGVALHGYTPAPGLPGFRRAVAADLQTRFGAPVAADGIYVCCGASAGLASCCRGLLREGEEAIAFEPFPPEYRDFVEGAGGVLKAVPSDGQLCPDWAALKAALGDKTALVLLSAALGDGELARLAELLETAQRRCGHPIYLLADASRLAFDGAQPPCPLRYYNNALLCCSYSGALDAPGEALGCLAVSEWMEEREAVFAAVAGAARASGYVNPPSLLQRAVERCL